MVQNKRIPKLRRIIFAMGGSVLGNPAVFRAAEKIGHYGEKLTPDKLIYTNSINAYGRFHQMPAIQKQTFRDWYIKNRKNS